MNKQEIEGIEAVAVRRTVSGLIWLCGGWTDRTHEQDAKVAGDTADIQTGQLQIIKRCLCLQSSLVTNVSISVFHATVLSIIRSYIMNRLNSCS